MQLWLRYLYNQFWVCLELFQLLLKFLHVDKFVLRELTVGRRVAEVQVQKAQNSLARVHLFDVVVKIFGCYLQHLFFLIWAAAGDQEAKPSGERLSDII